VRRLVDGRSWFLLAAALYAAAWVVALLALPERVPLHFGGAGSPDRWGSRAEALVVYGCLGLGLGALLGGAAALSERIPVSMINTPRKDWWTATPERVAELRRRNRADLYVIGAATLILLAVSLVDTVRAARSADPRLGAPFFVALAGYGLFLAVWVVRIVRDRTSTIDG